MLGGLLATHLGGCDFPGADHPQSRQEAYRFLNEASFGPSEAEISSVTALGYTQWINEQLATPSEITFQAYLEGRRAEMGSVNIDQIYEAFYTRALTSKAQLRNRVLLALSEIFVVSFQDAVLLQGPELMAGYLDLLDKALDGSYRDLLEAVSRSPAMGQYLTFASNAKENPIFGSSPDENYAREIMQLFSVGLYQLNPDGTVQVDGSGKPIESYTMADVKGLAKVFTGWTRDHGPGVNTSDRWKCFYGFPQCADMSGRYLPMVAYNDFHSVSEKAFLGVTIAPQGTPDPEGDLKAALDTLANHPNTAPFFCRQLIQKLVTSNPSPAYVSRVVARFQATNGNLGATVKAVLQDTDARSLLAPTMVNFGKLREPVLRMTAVLRAFNYTDSNLGATGERLNAAGKLSHATIALTSDTATSLGQSPFFAPSVFNFYRPGYVMPGSQSAQANLVAPEFQMVTENSVAGYTNFMVNLVSNGTPSVSYLEQKLTGPKLELSEQRAASQADDTLVAHVAERLLGGTISPALTQTITGVLQTMPVPAAGDTQASIDARNAVLDQRTRAAIMLVAVSPEFLIQR
ncbi:MAG: hypothetical protein RI907_1192 [Pseudomonadota bacterium]|jgi:uncharacterized protein (DUF1800 family)